MDELQLQKEWCDTVKELGGGWACKLSNKFFVGMPDVLSAIPHYATCLIEFKYLGDVKPGFDRQIDVTEKQALELERFQDAYKGEGTVGFVIVGAKIIKTVQICALPRQAKRASDKFSTIWRPRGVGGLLDIYGIYQDIGVPRIIGREPQGSPGG